MTTHPNNFLNSDSRGLTKREYFAALAMQGMLANSAPDVVAGYRAQYAVDYADRLIAALNEPICNECSCPLTDGHYDAEHDICSIAEAAR